VPQSSCYTRSRRRRSALLALVATLLPTILVAVLTVSTNTVHAASSKLEAETGTLGSEYAVGNDGTTTYIYPITNGAGSNPGSSARTVTYSVTLPAAGTYDLYVRVWIGPGGGNDDSFFVGNGFGTKSPANSAAGSRSIAWRRSVSPTTTMS